MNRIKKAVAWHYAFFLLSDSDIYITEFLGCMALSDPFGVNKHTAFGFINSGKN